jgi:hypothetical protein
MIWRVLIGVTVLLAIILLLAASITKTFRIQRSINIEAPAERVFELIDDLHNWPLWAPQDKEDASMKRIYSGTAKGTGAVSQWTSSGSAGEGRMLLAQSLPPRAVSIQVDWVKPFVTRNQNDFVLEGIGASTKVIWSMQGPNLFVMRIMGIFINMDRMMGKHFETGLANLKAVCEHGPGDELTPGRDTHRDTH